jgi:phosphoglycolate phosphatase-like HAD superfamily hydrolase
MWRHDELISLLVARGLHERFVRVDGAQRYDGGGKADRLRDHLVAQSLPGHDVVVIGDTVDDAAAAAAAVGASCLLVAEHSSHHIADLQAAADTVPTVQDAAARVLP